MNINEIAKMAGVSRATVSRYLNNGYVSEEKKKVISKVIEETGYQPSSQAQMLRTKKTKLVGVILPKIDSNTISREVAGISDILTQKGYQMILANTNNSVEEELKYLSLFKDNQVDGVIFIATILTKQHREMLKEYKVPIVLLGQHLEGYPCIFQDDHKAAMSLTEQMLKTGKKFGYITVTDKDEAVGKMRISGVEEILKKNNIGLDKSCVKCGNFTLESGYEKAEELFTAEDYVGLYDYLKSHQVYGQEEFKKYTERVRLYDDYHAFLRDLFQIQQVLDWPAGQQISPNDVKYVLWAGKNILERETGDSYRKLEYEENKEYYNDMKQDVAVALLGTFGMSEEELSELMGMERDSEKVDELVRRIFEREGWEYEED